MTQWQEARGALAAVGSYAVKALDGVDMLAQQLFSVRCMRGEIGNVPQALVVSLARVFGLDAVLPQVRSTVAGRLVSRPVAEAHDLPYDDPAMVMA